MATFFSHIKLSVLAAAAALVASQAFLPIGEVVAAEGAKAGTVNCGGYYTTDPGPDIQRLRWVLRNPGPETIYITRFRIYDWDGRLHFDSTDPQLGGFLPADLNGIIGSADNEIEGYAVAWFKSEWLVSTQPGVLPFPHTQPNAHVQLVVDWEANTSVIGPRAGLVRYQFDSGGNVLARGQSACSHSYK